MVLLIKLKDIYLWTIIDCGHQRSERIVSFPISASFVGHPLLWGRFRSWLYALVPALWFLQTFFFCFWSARRRSEFSTSWGPCLGTSLNLWSSAMPGSRTLDLSSPGTVRKIPQEKEKKNREKLPIFSSSEKKKIFEWWPVNVAGGILDRVDSYLFTGALAYSFVKVGLPLCGVWEAQGPPAACRSRRRSIPSCTFLFFFLFFFVLFSQGGLDSSLSISWSRAAG